LQEFAEKGIIKIVVSTSFLMENKDSEEAFQNAIKYDNINEPLAIGFGRIGHAYITDGKKKYSIKEIASIMFPDKQIDNLSSNEKNDIMHLVSCIEKDIKYFITRNIRDFIDEKKTNSNRNSDIREGQKRQKLEKFGTLIRTPEEMLEEIKKKLT
jgi:hypothetical protein